MGYLVHYNMHLIRSDSYHVGFGFLLHETPIKLLNKSGNKVYPFRQQRLFRVPMQWEHGGFNQERACHTFLQVTESRWIYYPCTSAICLPPYLSTWRTRGWQRHRGKSLVSGQVRVGYSILPISRLAPA